jgi:integrase
MGSYAPVSRIDTVDDTLRPRAVERAPATAKRQLTLGKAAEDHLAYLKTRGLSTKYVARTAASFKQMHEVLPKNLSLRDLDKAKLVMFTGHFLKRPKSKISGKPMSPDSVRTLFGDVKRLLDALDGEGWDGPKKWQRLFTARWTGLLTPAEQRKRARGKDTFTLEELKTLYDLANPRQRMLMLLALNTAMNQKEVSTLMRDDIDLEKGIISRIRHKTRAVAAVQVQWTMWPATTALVEQNLAPPNDGGLAFLTEDNHPLVNDATDTDSIALTWTRLLKTAERQGKEVRPLPFGTLRKTASTAILNLADESTQQQMLGHVRQSVAARHYTGVASYGRLDAAVMAFGEALVKVGIPVDQRPER